VAAMAPSTEDEMRTSAAIDSEQRKRAQDPQQRGRPTRMQIGPVEFGERAPAPHRRFRAAPPPTFDRDRAIGISRG
jgi:hypothetical protein